MRRGKETAIYLLLLVGLGVMLYPAVSDWINRLGGSYAIQQMHSRLENTDIDRQMAMAEEYNRKIREKEECTQEEYREILNISQGMMGYLQIPKIQADLPIYHGVGEETLAKGVGHMPETAVPIGGEGNHSVLTGHTGLPSAKLLTDLTELETGDLFYISILGQQLTYQVDQIKVVLPSDSRDLAPVPGKDYCTLVTCTPYGVNSHRLLVRGIRQEKTAAETVDIIYERKPQPITQFLWVFPVILLLPAKLLKRTMKKKRA